MENPHDKIPQNHTHTHKRHTLYYYIYCILTTRCRQDGNTMKTHRFLVCSLYLSVCIPQWRLLTFAFTLSLTRITRAATNTTRTHGLTDRPDAGPTYITNIAGFSGHPTPARARASFSAWNTDTATTVCHRFLCVPEISRAIFPFLSRCLNGASGRSVNTRRKTHEKTHAHEKRFHGYFEIVIVDGTRTTLEKRHTGNQPFVEQ